MQVAMANVYGGSGDSTRNHWTTPQWLADLIGVVDLDPCANERSKIRATTRIDRFPLETGIHDPTRIGSYTSIEFSSRPRVYGATARTTVFLNPPFARGEVLRWVNHYRHTRFIYLLKMDSSTEWYRALWPHVTHLWLPYQRINFDPPPGVKASSNAIQHALYLRNPEPALLDRLRPHGYLLTPTRAQ